MLAAGREEKALLVVAVEDALKQTQACRRQRVDVSAVDDGDTAPSCRRSSSSSSSSCRGWAGVAEVAYSTLLVVAAAVEAVAVAAAAAAVTLVERTRLCRSTGSRMSDTCRRRAAR